MGPRYGKKKSKIGPLSTFDQTRLMFPHPRLKELLPAPTGEEIPNSKAGQAPASGCVSLTLERGHRNQ